MQLSELLAYAPEEMLDAYITERQPARGEVSDNGWMLFYEMGVQGRVEESWSCWIYFDSTRIVGEYPGESEPGWLVDETGATRGEAMARAIMAAHKEVW